MSRRTEDRANSGHSYHFNSFAGVHLCDLCGTAEHPDGKFWLASRWSLIEPPCLNAEQKEWFDKANDKRSAKVLKVGKSDKCRMLNCGNGNCVHEWIPHLCPFCDSQLIHVTVNGHVFCSNHESICDYETDIKKLTEGNV